METKNQSVIVSGESGAGKVSRGSGMEVFKIIGIQLFTSFIIFADMDNTKTYAFHNRFDEFEVRSLLSCWRHFPMSCGNFPFSYSMAQRNTR